MRILPEMTLCFCTKVPKFTLFLGSTSPTVCIGFTLYMNYEASFPKIANKTSSVQFIVYNAKF